MVVFSTLLLLLVGTCLATIGGLLLLPKRFAMGHKVISLIASGILLLLCCVLVGDFDHHTFNFQMFTSRPWLVDANISIGIGMDGISIVFLVLTTLVFPFCFLASWELPNTKFLMLNLLCVEFFLILTFSTLDLFLFCLFFESLLIPMFLIILSWGSRERRYRALGYFFLYTLFGSIFLILALFLLYYETNGTSYMTLVTNGLSVSKQKVVWGLLFITFAIKIPLFPFHIWLPEAHVEAPTVGSVILAALLLKLGAYGMLRFLFLFDIAKFAYMPYALAICLVSICVASWAAICQADMKRIIAYSSIAHMSFALLGYFSNSFYGAVGGTLLMVSHGIVSAALFLLIGVLYDRHHTRSVQNYGGLVLVMPLFSFFFFMFTISNFSFPGTSNFVGELAVLVGLGTTALKVVLLLGAISTFFGLVYSILLYNRVSFGNLNIQFIRAFSDITRREYGILAILLILNMLMGIVPAPVILPISFSIKALMIQTLASVADTVPYSDLAVGLSSFTPPPMVPVSSLGGNDELFARYYSLAQSNVHYNAITFFKTLVLEGRISATTDFTSDFYQALQASHHYWCDRYWHLYSNAHITLQDYMNSHALLVRHEYSFTVPEKWDKYYPAVFFYYVAQGLSPVRYEYILEMYRAITNAEHMPLNEFIKLITSSQLELAKDYMLNPNTTLSVLSNSHELFNRFFYHPDAYAGLYDARLYFQNLITEGAIPATTHFEREFMPALSKSHGYWVEFSKDQLGVYFSHYQYMASEALLVKHKYPFYNNVWWPTAWAGVYCLEHLNTYGFTAVNFEMLYIEGQIRSGDTSVSFTDFVQWCDIGYQSIIADVVGAMFSDVSPPIWEKVAELYGFQGDCSVGKCSETINRLRSTDVELYSDSGSRYIDSFYKSTVKWPGHRAP